MIMDSMDLFGTIPPYYLFLSPKLYDRTKFEEIEISYSTATKYPFLKL